MQLLAPGCSPQSVPQGIHDFNLVFLQIYKERECQLPAMRQRFKATRALKEDVFSVGDEKPERKLAWCRTGHSLPKQFKALAQSANLDPRGQEARDDPQGDYV